MQHVTPYLSENKIVFFGDDARTVSKILRVPLSTTEDDVICNIPPGPCVAGRRIYGRYRRMPDGGSTAATAHPGIDTQPKNNPVASNRGTTGINPGANQRGRRACKICPSYRLSGRYRESLEHCAAHPVAYGPVCCFKHARRATLLPLKTEKRPGGNETTGSLPSRR